MISISPEFFFQIFNTLILALVPVILIFIAIIFFKRSKSTNNKISELEKRISNLENK